LIDLCGQSESGIDHQDADIDVTAETSRRICCDSSISKVIEKSDKLFGDGGYSKAESGETLHADVVHKPSPYQGN
jgi:hypothetical protein